MIEAALRSLVVSFPSVSAIVADRVNPARLPLHPGLPHITFFRVSTERFPEHGRKPGVVRPRFQLNCWGDGDSAYLQAAQLAEALRSGLDGWSGTVEGVDIYDIEVQGPRDGSPDRGATTGTVPERGLIFRSLDALIFHDEPEATHA